jgi:hypothetical protein
LLKAWRGRFGLLEVLQGACELQDPRCRPAILKGCAACVAACVREARSKAQRCSPDDPDLIESVIAASARFNVTRPHILGYAVCAVSLPSDHMLPNYVHAILKAYETWGTAISLDEIYNSVTEWLVSHHPDFNTVVRDNLKIA